MVGEVWEQGLLVALAATSALVLLAAVIILDKVDGGDTAYTVPDTCILCLEELV